MENGNSREDDAPVSEERKEQSWNGNGKDYGRLAYNSDGSSGVESPPSDIPTSTSSLCNPTKVYTDFIKVDTKMKNKICLNLWFWHFWKIQL